MMKGIRRNKGPIICPQRVYFKNLFLQIVRSIISTGTRGFIFTGTIIYEQMDIRCNPPFFDYFYISLTLWKPISLAYSRKH
jgi:hypothetical protein